ncbi:MAG: hypothetical protein AAB090_04820, partial [Nitrospirota bacterium]
QPTPSDIILPLATCSIRSSIISGLTFDWGAWHLMQYPLSLGPSFERYSLRRILNRGELRDCDMEEEVHSSYTLSWHFLHFSDNGKLSACRSSDTHSRKRIMETNIIDTLK